MIQGHQGSHHELGDRLRLDLEFVRQAGRQAPHVQREGQILRQLAERATPSGPKLIKALRPARPDSGILKRTSSAIKTTCPADTEHAGEILPEKPRERQPSPFRRRKAWNCHILHRRRCEANDHLLSACRDATPRPPTSEQMLPSVYKTLPPSRRIGEPPCHSVWIGMPANGLLLELRDTASHLSFPLRRRSDTSMRATARAQGTDREPPKLAHVRQPMTEVINPAWGFLARSKRGTRPMPAWLFGRTRQRRIQFCASGWEETKEGAAVWWRSPDDRTWL